MSLITPFESALTERTDLEELYKHFHRHPELSMQEERTAERIEQELRALGLQPQRIGGGVVAVIENGDGPVVLTRADFDALPVTEDTGLEYSSEADGVMHACGHDFHTTALIGAARDLVDDRDSWSGTVIALFQPGEETAEGAAAMVADGLADAVPAPDVALAQHVMPAKAGHIGTAVGPILSQGDSVKVTIHGKGSHGSMPHLAIDPVVIASSIVVRLQSIVGREVPPNEFSVVTVGAINSGTKSNIIPDSAQLLLNLRHYEPAVRDRVVASLERIIRAECEAGGCEKDPEIEFYDQFPLTTNDEDPTRVVTDAFIAEFGEEKVGTQVPVTASEDFSRIPDALGAPYTYWTVGGFEEPDGAPANHSPFFAPVLQPTLDVMVQAQITAVRAFVGK